MAVPCSVRKIVHIMVYSLVSTRMQGQKQPCKSGGGGGGGGAQLALSITHVNHCIAQLHVQTN